MSSKRFELKMGYEHPGLGDDNSIDPYANAKLAVVQWVGTFLERWYPGHAWHVEVDIRRGTELYADGVIKIRLNAIMPANRWWVIRVSKAMNDPTGAWIKKGAGELLERYNIPRTGFIKDEWRQALNNMPDFAKMTGKGHIEPLID